MHDMKYVLDANVFIEAAHRYYAFDLAPGFWESLVGHANNGRIQTIDRVKQELERGKDNLAEWANSHFSHACVSTDEETIIETYAKIMNWVNDQSQFFDATKAAFASGADGWLVAYVKVKGSVLVTQEVAVPDVRRRVPIPNVCQAFALPYVDTFHMLRKLGVQWTR